MSFRHIIQNEPGQAPKGNNDVLTQERDRIRRMADLYKAAALHSVTPTLVAITFREKGRFTRQKKQVIAAGSQSIICNDGTSIAIHDICLVEFV